MSELISTYAPANVEQELPVVSTVTDMNYSSSCYATDVPFFVHAGYIQGTRDTLDDNLVPFRGRIKRPPCSWSEVYTGVFLS